MANPMLWTNQSGYLTNNQLTKQFQTVAQPLMRFRQFVTPEPMMGAHKGEKVSWLQVSNLDTPGGVLNEEDLMWETNQGLAWNDVTVKMYGNAVPFSFKVEELSEFRLREIVRQGLQNDFAKVMDCVVERQFNQTALRYTGTAASAAEVATGGTASATNNSELNLYHLNAMVDQLKTRNVPGFNSAGGDYVLIGGVKAIRNLKRAMQSINQYTDGGYQRIANGEVGRIDGVRIIEDTFACDNVYDEDARTFTATTWTNGVSSPAYLFGSPTVREAIVVPEEIRAKEPTNYGLSHGLSWIFIGAYKIEWTAAANSRIIKWDSGA